MYLQMSVAFHFCLEARSHFAQQNPNHFLLPVFGFGAAAITAFYMFRMMFITFHGKPNMPSLMSDIHESPKEMVGPLFLLGTLKK